MKCKWCGKHDYNLERAGYPFCDECLAKLEDLQIAMNDNPGVSILEVAADAVLGGVR